VTVDRMEAFRDEPDPEPTPEPSLVDRWAESIISGRAILDRISPVRWLVRGLVPAEMVTGIYGLPGSGKSFVGLSLALELARGGYWNGEQIPEAFPVLYVAAERPSDIRDRLEAWSKFHGRDIPGGFHLWPSEFPSLRTEGISGPLGEFANEIGARVVMFDTFARMTVGMEENSSKDTGPVMDNLERLAQSLDGGAVVFIHHSGKDGTKGMRGSSAITGAISSGVEVTGSDGYLTATVRKSNVGPDGEFRTYRLEPVELDPLPGDREIRTSAVLVPGTRPPTNSEDLELILEVLRDELDGEAPLSDIREAFTRRGTKAPADKTVGNWLRALKQDGRVEIVGKAGGTRWKLPEPPAEEIPGL